MRGHAWTNERIALLGKLWDEGKTADAIAVRLGGTSRSAVLGKIFRLRLRLARRVSTDQSLPQPIGAPRPAFSQEISPTRRRARPRRYKPRLPSRAPAPTRGKTLLELTNESCRWPFGQPGTSKFHFCGAPGADLEQGKPYCERHARRAYSASAIEPTNHPLATEGAEGKPPALLRVGGSRPFRFGSSGRS
jgi:GcrA cell cycle regulator